MNTMCLHAQTIKYYPGEISRYDFIKINVININSVFDLFLVYLLFLYILFSFQIFLFFIKSLYFIKYYHFVSVTITP